MLQNKKKEKKKENKAVNAMKSFDLNKRRKYI